MLTEDEFTKLINAAQSYYDGLDTGLTDMEYDHLFNESGLSKSDLLSRIHLNGDTMNHRISIPTYTKITDWDKFNDYYSDTAVLTPKWDGCSTVAYYVNGVLDVILTRSDEVTGKVKTNTLKSKYPYRVDPRITAILAEALVPMKLSKGRADANGLVNATKDNKIPEIEEKLIPHAFDVITTEPMSYSDRMHLLDGLMPYKILSYEEAMYIKDNGNNGEYYTDGVVIYGDGYTQIFKVGSTESPITTVTKITIQVDDKYSLLTPIVHFEPVVINNYNIKKASNSGSVQRMKDKGIGIGASVRVHLANMTIPQIKDVITEGKYPEVFVCPECKKPVFEFQGKYVCKNDECTIWTKRYSNTKGDKKQFVMPPRYNGGNLTSKQIEYVKLTSEIYEKVKNRINGF